jgi:hypothetical protein
MPAITREQPAWYTKLVRAIKSSPKTRAYFAEVLGLSIYALDDMIRPGVCPRVDQADAIARDLGYQIHVLPAGIDRPPTDLPGLLQAVRREGFTLVPIEAPTVIPRHERRDPQQLDEAIQTAVGGARVILHKDGHDIAAVIPLADLRRLEMFQTK